MAKTIFDYERPKGLTSRGLKALETIVGVIKKKHDQAPDVGWGITGGCTPFYSPKEWAARKEKYGVDSHLIICHDGGILDCIFGPYSIFPGMYEEMRVKLAAEGFYVEACTGWYSAVYDIR